MPVYIVQAGDADGPVKIGWARDIARRVAEHQTGNHLPLTVLRVLPGARAEEAWLHARFRALRLRSEWFSLDPEMLTIDVALSRESASAEITTKLSQWLRAQGLTLSQLASAIGTSVSVLSRVNRGRRQPTANLALKIERRTNGAVRLQDLLKPHGDGQRAA